MKKLILIAAILLDAAIVAYLAGGLAGVALFVVFVGTFFLPACALAMRLPHVRSMPADLRFTAAAVLVVILIVPWFFVRKLLPATIVDVVCCAVLTGAAVKFGRLRVTLGDLGLAWKRSRFVVTIVLPVLFALVWLGYGAPVGDHVMFHGLFAIDFGNLVSIVSTVRASPLLPLA